MQHTTQKALYMTEEEAAREGGGAKAGPLAGLPPATFRTASMLLGGSDYQVQSRIRARWPEQMQCASCCILTLLRLLEVTCATPTHAGDASY